MKFRNTRKYWVFESNPEAASSQPTALTTPADEGGDFSAEPSSEAPESGDDSSDLFSEMTTFYEGGGSEEDSEGEVTSPSRAADEPAAPTEAVEVPPAPQATEPPPSLLPESAQVPVTPVPTPVQPQPTTEAAPPTVQPTQEEIQAQFEEHRKTTLPQLQARYKLDDKTVAELESNPGEVIPQLFAQMHYDMTQALFSGVMSQIPQMVTQQMRQTQKQAELEGAFYGKYPGLRAHEGVVQQALSAAMSNGFAKTYEEVEQVAATLAAIQLKVPLEELMGKAPTLSAPIQASGPSIPQMARPIAPTSSGASIAPQGQSDQKSLWGEMVDFEMEQSG